MIWKVVDECPNLEVSDEGMVRDRQTGKLRRGKRGVKINGRYIEIYRLVAKAFVSNPHNCIGVTHKDGDKKNNHSSNLMWGRNKSKKFFHTMTQGQEIVQVSLEGDVVGVYLPKELPKAFILSRVNNAAMHGTVYKSYKWYKIYYNDKEEK